MPITTRNKSLVPTDGNDRENDPHNTVENPRDSSLVGSLVEMRRCRRCRSRRSRSGHRWSSETSCEDKDEQENQWDSLDYSDREQEEYDEDESTDADDDETTDALVRKRRGRRSSCWRRRISIENDKQELAGTSSDDLEFTDVVVIATVAGGEGDPRVGGCRAGRGESLPKSVAILMSVN